MAGGQGLFDSILQVQFTKILGTPWLIIASAIADEGVLSKVSSMSRSELRLFRIKTEYIPLGPGALNR